MNNNNGTPTMEAEGQVKTRYTKTELEEFKQIINGKIQEAKNLTNYYLGNLKGNPNGIQEPAKDFQDGASSTIKESNSELAVRQERFMLDLQNALLRIRNRNYGVCAETGELIDKKRLKLVPHATMTVAGKNAREIRESKN